MDATYKLLVLVLHLISQLIQRTEMGDAWQRSILVLWLPHVRGVDAIWFTLCQKHSSVNLVNSRFRSASENRGR